MLSLSLRWTKNIRPVSSSSNIQFLKAISRYRTSVSKQTRKQQSTSKIPLRRNIFPLVDKLTDGLSQQIRNDVRTQATKEMHHHRVTNNAPRNILESAIKSMRNAEKQDIIIDHHSFLKFITILYRYGHGDKAVEWCTYYSKKAGYVDSSYAINTLLIRINLDQKRFEDAVLALKQINARTSIEYCNIYRMVINALAKNGKLDEAFALFHEMFEVFFNCVHERGHFIGNQDTYITLLSACISPELEAPNSISNDAAPSSLDSQQKHAKAFGVFEHLHDSGAIITRESLPVLRRWFMSDPVNKWKIKECVISNEGICSNCGEQLKQKDGLEPEIQAEIEDFILTVLCKQDYLTKSPNYERSIEKFSVFLKHIGTFDVVIDGMNVGLDPSHPFRTQQTLMFSDDQVIKTVNYFTDKGKKVLLILKSFGYTNDITSSSNNSFSKLLALPSSCKVFYTMNNHFDDIFLLYALAFNQKKLTHIVTKDSFSSHCPSLPTHLLRYKFLKWTSLQTLNYFFHGPVNDVDVTIVGENYDSSFQWTDTSFHISCTTFDFKCVQKIDN